MKRIYLPVIILLVLIGCEKNNELEIIPDYDRLYNNETELDQLPELLEGNEQKLTEELQKQYEGEDELNLSYKIYIDEKGSPQKIQAVNSAGEKLDQLVLNEIKEWKFQPGFINDQPVKSQFKLVIGNSQKDKVTPDEFLITVEEMPMPVGGLQSIQQNITYPETAKVKGVEGKVFVMAYIDTSGDVVKTEIIKSAGEELDKAAIEAIKMTKFTPGRHEGGKAVKTRITIPIVFKLQ